MKLLKNLINYLQENISKNKAVWFCLIALVTGFIYYLTLAPTMFWIDAAIYLATVNEFGIAYPPGFPLYVIVAKAWSYLPLPGFDFTQKLNFLSSVFASLASGFLYLTILKLFENRFSFLPATAPKKTTTQTPENISFLGNIIAAFSALAFGFSHSLWYQATYSEVYTFHIFLIILVIYFIISFATETETAETYFNKKQKFYLVGAALFYGLSFANHPMTIGFIPPLIWFLIKIKKRLFLNKKFFTALFIIFSLTGFLPYIYMPLRSAQNPIMDWGNPENIGNFINHVTGRHWTGEASNFVFLNEKFFANIVSWAYFSYWQFFVIGLIFLFIGVLFIRKISPRFFTFLLLFVLGAGFWGTAYITGEYESWLIPTYVAGFIFMASGFYFLSEHWMQKSRYIPKIIIFSLLIFLIFGNLKNNWPILDRHKNFYPEEVGHNILKNVEDGSIVISEAGMALSSIVYQQMVLKEKSNIIAIHRNSFWAPWMRQNLEKYQKERGLFLPEMDLNSQDLKNPDKRSKFNNKYLEAFIKGNIDKFNIYTVMPDSFEGIKIIPAGFIYKYSKTDENPDLKYWNFDFKISEFCKLKLPTLKDFSLRSCFQMGMEIENGKGFYQPPDIQIQSNKDFEEIKAGYSSGYKNLADIYFSEKEFEKAAYYYDRVINLLNDNFTAEQKFEINMRKGIAIFNAEKYDEAVSYFNGLYNDFPKNKDVLWFLIASYGKIGKIKEAAELLTEVLKNNPNDKNFTSLMKEIFNEQLLEINQKSN